ncbi:hypothetical protein J2S36_000915 [Arcanobacterium hippocoleae]|uniref:Uncharacterized protein n=1 Tax=Arcanobacterium hippocoleae TaxID=149017 RepID=A0ABU1T1Y6_9ACTO|nr:hypothetical protein [Arcanobacterium hippocoleae]
MQYLIILFLIILESFFQVMRIKLKKFIPKSIERLGFLTAYVAFAIYYNNLPLAITGYILSFLLFSLVSLFLSESREESC